ncbi:hypothetical protein FOZ62_013288, partial [Perkinsus olseni]
ANRAGSHYAMQVVACSGVNCDKFDREEWRGDFRGKVNQDYKLSFTKGGMCCRTESFTFQNDAFVRTDCAQCERGGTGPSDMTEFKAHPDTKRYITYTGLGGREGGVRFAFEYDDDLKNSSLELTYACGGKGGYIRLTQLEE